MSIDLFNLPATISEIARDIRTLYNSVSGGSTSGTVALLQAFEREVFAGFDNGTVDTQLHSGARLAPQGLCRLDVLGTMYDFVLLQDDTLAEEAIRVAQYEVGDEVPIAVSNILSLAHGQDLSGTVAEDGSVTLYCQADILGAEGKGISVIEWMGDATDQLNVTAYQLLGTEGTGQPREDFYSATVAVSGDEVWLFANDAKEVVDDTGHTVFCFSLSEVTTLANPLDATPLFGPWPLSPGSELGQQYLQGGTVYEGLVVTQRGFVNPRERALLQFHDKHGNLIRSVEYAGSLNDYTSAELLDHPTYGTLITYEPEGVTVDPETGALLVLGHEEWREPGDVVEFYGRNFTPRRASVTSEPSNSNEWVETSLPASGPWVAGTYTWGTGDYTRRAKVIHAIAPDNGGAGQGPLGNDQWHTKNPAILKTGASAVDMVVPKGQDFLVGSTDFVTGIMSRLFGLYDNRSLRLFDSRTEGDQDKYGAVLVDFSEDRETLNLRANRDRASGSGLLLSGDNDTVHKGGFKVYANVGSVNETILGYDPELDHWDYARLLPQKAAGSSGARVLLTGTTTANVLRTIPVRAGSVGPNGTIEVDILTSHTDNANDKILRVRMGGQTVLTTTEGVTGTRSARRLLTVQGRNNSSLQVATAASAAMDPGESTLAPEEHTIDTDAGFSVVVEAELTDPSDYIALERISVTTTFIP